MNRRHVLVSALAFTSAITAVGQPRDLDSERIDAYLSLAVEQSDVPGIVAMVADGDRILYSGAFGKSNVERDVEMTSDAIFRIASMTKPITSVAVQILIEEGKVSLDDTISTYLPAFEDKQVIETFDATDRSYTTRPAAAEITVRHLLTHTSGIGYGFSNEILAQLADPSPGVSVQGLPLLFDPGTRWAYGESTRVLGTLVETLTGQSLDDFMEERIFVPLDMTDTFYVVPARKAHRVVTIHNRDEQGLVEMPNPEEIAAPDNGDGGLHSTAADYMKFVQMFLNSGLAHDGARLLSEESVRLMGQNHTGNVRVELQPAALPAWTRPFPLGAGRDTFGLGFQVTGAHDRPDMRRPGSMSLAGIFNTEFWIDPESGIGAVLLMQYLPFYDDAAIATLQGFERRVYEAF